MAPNTTSKYNSKGTMSRPNRRPTGLDTDAADEHVEKGEPEVVSSDSEVERMKKKKKKTKNELKSGERGEKPLPKPLMREICLMLPSQPSTPSTSAPRRQLRLLGPRHHPLFVPRDQLTVYPLYLPYPKFPAIVHLLSQNNKFIEINRLKR